MKVIIGLGNPGEKFTQTRHNVGFLAVDALHAYLVRLGVAPSESGWEKVKGMSALRCNIDDLGGKTILVKPQTFMNKSGEVVKFYLKKYATLSPAQVLVVHDDMGFSPGEYKFSFKKEANSHNGVQSIITTNGTSDFWRLRIGIGGVDKSERNQDAAEYVLSPFSYWENQRLKVLLSDVLPEQMLLWAQGKIN